MSSYGTKKSISVATVTKLAARASGTAASGYAKHVSTKSTAEPKFLKKYISLNRLIRIPTGTGSPGRGQRSDAGAGTTR